MSPPNEESPGFTGPAARRDAAAARISGLIEKLPGEIAQVAGDIPLCLDYRPSAEMIEEPGEEGLLGLFVGEPVGMAGQSAEAMPPQIFIFTENIWEEAGRKPRRFLKEVGTTYLHELGHGLGWDEADLRLRDLD